MRLRLLASAGAIVALALGTSTALADELTPGFVADVKANGGPPAWVADVKTSGGPPAWVDTHADQATETDEDTAETDEDTKANGGPPAWVADVKTSGGPPAFVATQRSSHATSHH